MAPHAVSADQKRVRTFVFACFFLSGLSALIYEVAWLNRIQLVMGHTVYSLSTTLAAYLSGLALGALAVPRLRRSGLSPLWIYFFAELGIGVYGLGFQSILNGVELPYHALVSHVELSLPVLSFVQFLFCGAVILAPTFLMGTTLPMLSDHLYRGRNEISAKLPTLYAINTLGACAGSLIAGFMILPALGYTATIYLAAAINIALFFGATLVFGDQPLPSLDGLTDAFRRTFAAAAPSDSREPLLSDSDRAAALTLFVSGAASMLIQVIWNRLAGLGFGSSVYVFPLVTCVVLGGIVLGSFAVRRHTSDPERARLAMTLTPGFAALLLSLGNYAFSRSPLVAWWTHGHVQPGFALYTVVELAWMTLCLLLPSAAVGAIFPAASSVLSRDKEDGARAIGVGYALNIAGLILGAVLGSFWLLPAYGIEVMAQLVILALCVTGPVAAHLLRRGLVPALALSAVALVMLRCVPSFDRTILTSGYFYNRGLNLGSFGPLQASGFNDLGSLATASANYLVAYRDDPHATVSIHTPRGGHSKVFESGFRINGKPDGNTRGDEKTVRILTLLPMLAKLDARRVLTIGLGTGTSAAETLGFPKMEQTTVIELSPAMVDFARKHFDFVNSELWKDSRFRLINRDGREFLRHTPEQFDLIMSEPSNPWVDGVASLFTVEYFRELGARLATGGLAVLWFHTYNLDCPATASVLNAAAEAFPSLQVFSFGGDFFILARNESGPIELSPFPTEMATQEATLFRMTQSDSAAGKQARYRELISRTLLADRGGVVDFFYNFTPNTDDNQLLQYASGRSYFTKGSCPLLSSLRDTELIERASAKISSALAQQ